MNMEQEIKAAVDWWTNQLRQPAHHDTGSGMNSAFVNAFTERFYSPLSDEQLVIFRAALQEEITNMVAENAPREDAPMWGAALRCFGTDYHPDAILERAADKAGIDNQHLRFPVKTIMWIDPRRVTVRNGYGAPTQTIYPETAGVA